MKFVFLSNYFNHHQLPLCENLYRVLGSGFTFVATEPIVPARLKQGYSDMNSQYSFVVRSYESDAQLQLAQHLTDEADVVIIGSAPMTFLENRLRQNKLTFLYSERMYKSGYEAWKWPVRMWRFWKKYSRHKSLYLLCASAYTAWDYARTYTFLNKTYRWGYFPEVRRYDVLPTKTPSSILWAGRFLDWKHPEQVVEVARRLKNDGYDFHITMLGSGEQWDTIQELVKAEGLQDQIQLTGAVSAENVRSYMETAQIFLFTSDRNEGWGAVLNESMNSGCAVVACSAIGSVPFLMQSGENGLAYPQGDVDALYAHVKYLLDDPAECEKLGKAAYATMTSLWNAETAVTRLLVLCEALLSGDPHPHLYDEGPCSKAEILKD